jgi:hypothetical protein
MDSRIKFMFALIVFGVSVFIDMGCRIVPNRSVAATLAAQTGQALDGAEVQLRSMTDFEWTGFVALGPYTTRKEAERTLGFEWPEYSAFKLDSSDAFSLIVFVNAKKVARVEQVDRCHPDFGQECLSRMFDQTHAVFILKKGHCNVLHLRSAG